MRREYIYGLLPYNRTLIAVCVENNRIRKASGGDNNHLLLSPKGSESEPFKSAKGNNRKGERKW